MDGLRAACGKTARAGRNATGTHTKGTASTHAARSDARNPSAADGGARDLPPAAAPADGTERTAASDYAAD